MRRMKMIYLSNFIVAFLSLLHIFILILEMFFWESPASLRAFNITPELARETVVIGANQGLYNGFLAAGLAWGLILGSRGRSVKVFFLMCVLIAGIFGAVTVQPRILVIQAVPAAISLLLLWRSPRERIEIK